MKSTKPSRKVPPQFVLDDQEVEELRRCANNPKAFASLREAYINRYLGGLDNQQRELARNLQAEIDMARISAGTPSGALRQVMDMLGDRADALNALSGRLSMLDGKFRG